MTGIKRRSPTNKEFKTNFQGLASTKTKKGHLNSTQERKAEDTVIEEGVLVRIDREKLYKKGWEVKVGTGNDAKTYHCSYGDGVMYIPDSTVTKKYFIPKGKVEVELTIDKKTKIYTVTKIKTNGKTPIALFEDTLTISIDTDENNTDENAELEVSNKYINMKANSVIITDEDDNEIDLLEENKNMKNQIQDLANQTSDLIDQNKKKEETIQELMKRIEILEYEANDNTEETNGE